MGIDAEAVFAELEPAIAAVRNLARFEDFSDSAPHLPPAEAKAKIGNLEASFGPHADALNARLAALSKDLNAAEKANTPFNPATMMKMAASHRTGGAPDPLPALFAASPETGPLQIDDWASLQKFAEARRRYFTYWLGTLESFRKNAKRRCASLA